MTIGQRIKKCRLALGMSQAAVAQAVTVLAAASKQQGLHQVAISQLEAGLVNGTTYVASLAHVLGVNALWLETGQGKPDLGYTPPAQIQYCREIQNVIKLMQSTDDRGREKARMAVEDAVDARKAFIDSLPLPRSQEVDPIGELASRLRQKLLPEMIESEREEREKTSNDVYISDTQQVQDRKDKRH